MIFVAIVVVVGIVIAMVWFNLQKKKAAQSWPSAQGTITASDIQRSRDSDGNTDEQARVSYSYSVNGKAYQGNRIGFFSIGSASQLHQKYPVGKVVEVFHDPADPSKSVLER